MKRAIYLLAVVGLVGVLAGCASHRKCGMAQGGCASAEATPCQGGNCQGNCDGVQQCGFFEKVKCRMGGCNDGCGERCGGLCGGRCGGHFGKGCAGPATMPYPYYMNRGPRDFLAPNPPSIGP